MERAVAFYEKVFDFEMMRHPMGPVDMSFFPWKEDGMGASGGLIHHKEHYTPSTDGILVYFTSRAGDVNVRIVEGRGSGWQDIET